MEPAIRPRGENAVGPGPALSGRSRTRSREAVKGHVRRTGPRCAGATVLRGWQRSATPSSALDTGPGSRLSRRPAAVLQRRPDQRSL
jgi:hypothetical protein